MNDMAENDFENKWAVGNLQGLKKYRKRYEETCQEAYKVFWENGISVDIINMDCDILKYDLVVEPMLYMVRLDVYGIKEDYIESCWKLWNDVTIKS